VANFHGQLWPSQCVFTPPLPHHNHHHTHTDIHTHTDTHTQPHLYVVLCAVWIHWVCYINTYVWVMFFLSRWVRVVNLSWTNTYTHSHCRNRYDVLVCATLCVGEYSDANIVISLLWGNCILVRINHADNKRKMKKLLGFLQTYCSLESLMHCIILWAKN
jgi:hypothetical protein